MKAIIHTLSLTTITVVTLLLTLTGCTLTEVVSPEEASAKVIRFQPVMGKVVETRAPIMTMDYMKDFRVVSIYDTDNKTGYFNDLSTYLFDRVIVSKADDGSWTYNPPMLWPGYITEANFYAWSPARSPNAVFVSHPDEENYDKYDPYLRYTVPADINPNGQGIQQQEDLLVARREEITSASTPIALHFQHALSRVVFRARSETLNLSYYIKEVTLCNVHGQGVLNMSDSYIPEDGAFVYDDPYYGYDYSYYMWSTEEDRLDYTVSLPADGAAFVPYTADPSVWTDLHPSTNALMVIPQWCEYTDVRISDVKDDYALQVKVVYNVAGGDARADRTVYLNVCKPGTLDDGLVFEMGRQYNFDITLTDAVPTFTLTMSDWNTTPPDVPVPARLGFEVGDQFDQDGLRGVVSEVNDAGAATKILQIVPLPSTDLGTMGWTSTDGNWSSLTPEQWYSNWNAYASAPAQEGFSLITDPSLNASGTVSLGTSTVSLDTEISLLMGELSYLEVVTNEETLGSHNYTEVWRRRKVRGRDFTPRDSEIHIITNPSSSSTLNSVSLDDTSIAELDEIGILVEKVFDAPVYRKYVP
jgi:hypothetical protein